MTFDICLYGHLTFDTIFEGFEQKTAVGSMGNVWKGLKEVNPFLSIILEPMNIGEALILVDKETNRRTSQAVLNLISRIPNIHQAKWSHILYLNELSYPNIVEKNLGGIISVDVCRGKKLDLKFLKNIHWLFISEDEDMYYSPQILLQNGIKNGIVEHCPVGSRIITRDTVINSKLIQTIDKINVLGAGDIFAACFINNCLKNNILTEQKIEYKYDKLKEILDITHKDTTNILKKRI